MGKEHLEEVEKVVEFSRKVSLNYDCLRSIAFELNSGSDFASAIIDLNIMTTEDEEYNVYVYFENGTNLHHWRFRTNLFDYDISKTGIRMYNENGNGVLDIYFDKRMVMYDISKNATVIPAEGFKLDFDGYDNNAETVPFRNVKPLYMTFQKRAPKNLHYLV